MSGWRKCRPWSMEPRRPSRCMVMRRVKGETVLPDNFQVVCSWLSGGCGASGGVRRTEVEAIATWNARAYDAPKRTCELEETESYECRRFDAADPKLYATRLTVHVLECSECGRTCEHVNGTYPRCPYCSAFNVLDEDYEQVIENAENYKLTDDSEPQVIATSEKHELADSRERLEADIKKYRWEHGETSGRVTEWLERQAAITERELCGRCSPYATAKDYMDTIDSLTVERDELRKQLAEGLRKELNRRCDQLKERIAELEAERDELRGKLREKQHVCDVQRDSFAKMEREYRELQDVCGELERTIENMRGME